MNIIKTILLSIALVFISYATAAQEITGLWEITEVQAGSNEMTPDAKWTMINGDGTFRSGNGWIQNSVGTWKWNSSNQFEAQNKYGIHDEYGAFDVQINNSKMKWERMEEETKVTVSFKRIEELPMTVADKAAGLWELVSSENSNEKISEISATPEGKFLFLRWDRIYVAGLPGKDRPSGFWHIKAHYPEITLIGQSGETYSGKWLIKFNEGKLHLQGNDLENQDAELIFKRRHQFPAEVE